MTWINLFGGEFSFRYSFEIDSNDFSQSWMELWNMPADSVLNSRIILTYTRPNYGGVRWWFLCPILKNGLACNRRTGRLYLPRREKYFGCRQCHNLTYASSQENHRDTILSRTAKRCGVTQRQVLADVKEFFASQLETSPQRNKETLWKQPFQNTANKEQF